MNFQEKHLHFVYKKFRIFYNGFYQTKKSILKWYRLFAKNINVIILENRRRNVMCLNQPRGYFISHFVLCISFSPK